MTDEWKPATAVRDQQSITAAWQPVQDDLITGVRVKEVRNVLKSDGFLTELLRGEWLEGDAIVGQVFQVRLEPGVVSAWHGHESTTDRLCVTDGQMKLVLYDDRPGSPTRGRVNELRLGLYRPMLVVVPPMIWHGIQNLAHQPSTIINMPDCAYRYNEPDHWRLPPDTEAIPYRFGRLA